MRTGLFMSRMPADARLLRERRAAAAREAIAARRGGGGWAALGAEALARFRAGMDTHAIGRDLGEPEPIVAAALDDRRAAERMGTSADDRGMW